MAQATTTVPQDEVARHREKARFATDDDKDGSPINRIGLLNKGAAPGEDRSLLRGTQLRKAGGGG
jgi:hypothetical protein